MLTPKKAAFVQQFLVDMNATQAYLRAGYKCSLDVARRNASRLLTNADVAAAIEAARADLAERTKRSVDDVMADIAKVRANAMQTAADPETALPVMVSHKDALRALELEGKHLGAFEKDNAQKAGGFVDLLMRVTKK